LVGRLCRHLGRWRHVLARESWEAHVWLVAAELLLRRRSALVVAPHGRTPTLKALVVGLLVLLLAEPVVRHGSLLLVAWLIAEVQEGAQKSKDVCQVA